MSMTRKHFESVAETINGQIGLWRAYDGPGTEDAVTAINLVARQLAEDFQNFNENFDPDRFLTACGVTPNPK